MKKILILAGISSGESTSYIHGADGVLAKVNGSGTYYYHSDHLGSTSAMTNEAGDIIEEQVNLPFGQLISGSEKFGFTGKEKDETGLQYFGARYYDNDVGRFLTFDPMGEQYIYANNNPLSYVDPDGMTAINSGAFSQSQWDAYRGVLQLFPDWLRKKERGLRYESYIFPKRKIRIRRKLGDSVINGLTILPGEPIRKFLRALASIGRRQSIRNIPNNAENPMIFLFYHAFESNTYQLSQKDRFEKYYGKGKEYVTAAVIFANELYRAFGPERDSTFDTHSFSGHIAKGILGKANNLITRKSATSLLAMIYDKISIGQMYGKYSTPYKQRLISLSEEYIKYLDIYTGKVEKDESTGIETNALNYYIIYNQEDLPDYIDKAHYAAASKIVDKTIGIMMKVGGKVAEDWKNNN